MKALTKAIRDLQILMTEKRGNVLVQSNLNYTKMVETGTSVSSQGKGIFFLSVCERARARCFMAIHKCLYWFATYAVRAPFTPFT